MPRALRVVVRLVLPEATGVPHAEEFHGKGTLEP